MFNFLFTEKQVNLAPLANLFAKAFMAGYLCPSRFLFGIPSCFAILTICLLRNECINVPFMSIHGI